MPYHQKKISQSCSKNICIEVLDVLTNEMIQDEDIYISELESKITFQLII